MKRFVSENGDCVKELRKRRMKGGKDVEKEIDPLFPRLHINDAEKGGPRAPPRNKMALCEQLSIHSQMLPSGSLLPNNNSNLVPLTSSSHGGSHKRSVFSSFSNSPLKPTGHLTTSAECNLFPPHTVSNSKNSSVNKLGDENDYNVPTFAQSGKTSNFGNCQQNTNKEKLTSSSSESCGQLQTAFEKRLKRTGSTDLKSRQHLGNQTEEYTKVSQTSQDRAKKPASNMSAGDEMLADTSSSPLARGRISEPVNNALGSPNQKRRISLVDYISRLSESNVQSHQEHRVLQENKILTDGALAEHGQATTKRSASTMEGLSGSRSTLGDHHRSPTKLETVGECRENQDCGSPKVDVDRNGDISDTSVVDSIFGLDISPDDVVGVLGQKEFWNTRRTIVHQQRIFAVQVFELHRLIKVQRLIARSAELMLEDSFLLSKPSMKVSPVKKLPPENVVEPPLLIVNPKVDPDKPKASNESAAESTVRKPPLASLNNDVNKGVTWQSYYKPYSGIPPPASTAIDANLAPWNLHPPPGNQWLIPVSSPSEGLVYKPYTGPCPPTPGLVAPVYGSCGPTSLVPVCGDFLMPAYRVPISHHQGTGIFSGTPVCQTYFGPYGVPFMNPSGSSSAVEQVIPFARAQPSRLDVQLPIRDIDFTIRHQNSCNKMSQKSGMISGCLGNLQASKGRDLLGSTASSPSESGRGDALPLFPTAPIQVSDQTAQNQSSERRIQVIKVVPHNPKTASESAARIFQSIQQERKLYD